MKDYTLAICFILILIINSLQINSLIDKVNELEKTISNSASCSHSESQK